MDNLEGTVCDENCNVTDDVKETNCVQPDEKDHHSLIVISDSDRVDGIQPNFLTDGSSGTTQMEQEVPSDYVMDVDPGVEITAFETESVGTEEVNEIVRSVPNETVSEENNSADTHNTPKYSIACVGENKYPSENVISIDKTTKTLEVGSVKESESIDNGTQPEKPSNIPQYSNPGGILDWREEIVTQQKLGSVDHFIQYGVTFYCFTNSQEEDLRSVLRSQPGKFLTYNCIAAVQLAVEEKFDEAYEALISTKNLLQLYKDEIEEWYDFEGFLYCIDLTISSILEIDYGDPVKPEFKELNRTNWNDLSAKAQSVVLAAKLYYTNLLKAPVPKVVGLAKMILRLADDIPEWHCLCCQVLRRKRLESNLVIVKPKKTEMDSLRMALDLDPSNTAVCITLLENLFDWMRTDDRKPQIEVLGVYLETVYDIASFLHGEIVDLLMMNPPAVFQEEIHLIASSFYGYRNLPLVLLNPVDDDAPFVKGSKYDEVDGITYEVLAQSDCRRLAEKYLSYVFRKDPKNAHANLIQGYRYLRMFQREKALEMFINALQVEPLNEAIILAYVRASIGADENDRRIALDYIDNALSRKFRSPLTVAHLHFLKGCLLWLVDDLSGCVRAWVDGLYFDAELFLSQFSFWTKSQVRKYLWPSSLVNFAVVESLKEALRLFATLPEATAPDPRIPGACAAFLKELDVIFPLTTQNAREISKLSRRWFYLLEGNEGDPDDDSDDEEGQIYEKTWCSESNPVEIIDLRYPPRQRLLAKPHETNPNLIEILPQETPYQYDQVNVVSSMKRQSSGSFIHHFSNLKVDNGTDKFCTVFDAKNEPSLAPINDPEVIVIDEESEVEPSPPSINDPEVIMVGEEIDLVEIITLGDEESEGNSDAMDTWDENEVEVLVVSDDEISVPVGKDDLRVVDDSRPNLISIQGKRSFPLTVGLEREPENSDDLSNFFHVPANGEIDEINTEVWGLLNDVMDQVAETAKSRST